MTRKRLLRMMFGSIVGLAIMIPATPATAGGTTLQSALTGGATEVPDPGDPDGFGAAQVDIKVQLGRLCFDIVVFDVDLPTAAAHVHRGAAGVAGPIRVTLEAPVEVAGTGIGLASGCVRGIPRQVLRNIRNDPAGFYVNVHNAAFPGGAVRGQLQAA
jgi:hypothetical protein